MYPSPLPMPIPSTLRSQNIAETVRQVDDLVQDPEDEKEKNDVGDNCGTWATF